MWSETKKLYLSRFASANEDESVGRESPEYVLSLDDLVEFARCPARWVLGASSPPARGYRMTDVTCEILLKPDDKERHIIREPDTYRTTVLVCPVCESESLAKHCSKCDSDRKPKQVDKPWARSAKPCIRWAEDCARVNLTTVRSADWDLAEGAAVEAASDPDAAALLKDADTSCLLLGQYRSKPSDAPLWVRQRVDILPRRGHALDCALGLVYATTDSGHHKHSSMAHFRYWHMEAALALDLANACPTLDGDFREVLQLVVEMEAPHIIARRRLARSFSSGGGSFSTRRSTPSSPAGPPTSTRRSIRARRASSTAGPRSTMTRCSAKARAARMRGSESPTRSTDMRRRGKPSPGRARQLSWVRYAPRDWLLALAGVSAAAELAHRRLADMVWAVGEWPVNEPETLARLVRQDSTALPALLKELRSLGWRRAGSCLRNEAVAAVRREAVRTLLARRAISRAGNFSRWHADGPSPRRSGAGGSSTEGSGHAGGIPDGKASALSPGRPAHADGIPDGMPTASTVHDKQDSTVHAIKDAERSTLSVSPHKQGSGEAEKEFLQAVHDVLEAWRKGSATAELQNWGGWWRTAFRKNPRKARAVLNDVSAMARERRVTSTPGAAALDLWKRLP
jgi:hypothetical protein